MQSNFGISVIIPNYNRAAFLKQAIESVLAQTYPVLEILICDDGSQDESRSVVQAFADDRIQWLDCGRNGRPAIPRNKGIQRAKGQWLAFLDNDDVWLPEKLELQIAALQQQKVHAVCTNAKIIGPGKSPENCAEAQPDQQIDFKTLVKSNVIICSSVVIQKALFLKSGAFPESPSLKALEDYAAWLQASLYTDFYFIGSPLLYYRDDSANSIRTESLSTREQLSRIHKHFRQWSKKNKTGCTKTNYYLLRDTFVTRFLSERRGKLYNFLHP